MEAVHDDDRRHMARAIELAQQGEGLVEPNPMVGCVLAKDGQVVGEGWHRQFGGPHAEIVALQAAGERARGATAYVSLEPCCHVGKTPPCTRSLIEAGVKQVYAACTDPNPSVSGNGLAELSRAGIATQLGLLEDQAKVLIEPFEKLVTRGRPWIIAKWAMSVDGKLAAPTGDSRWITGEQSRAVVHQLRGRVDGVMVGHRTATIDDPLLTARPPGPRQATRIVLTSAADLAIDSQLVRTARDVPVLVAAYAASSDSSNALRTSGVEVWQSAAAKRTESLAELLDELGRRQFTNVLVEGGGQVLGALLELGEIDEVHAFIGPLIIGGNGPTPVAGTGFQTIASGLRLRNVLVETLGNDIYLTGRTVK